MHLISILPLTCLLAQNLPLTTAADKAEKKQWQEVPSGTEDSKLEAGYSSGAGYSNRDVNGYSTGPEYASSTVNGYSAGPEYQGNDMGNYGSGYGNSYDGNVRNNGYGGDMHSGGYGGESHSNSYSESHSGDFGNGLQTDGWDKPVKTVVKHVYKNIAVPHPVPAPVQIPVPKYVKYFKPFAIARPVGVPHIIPVIKHIQKPIPYFTSLPIQQAVPVPKFIGLPVQVRVPRPVFIHVPKIVPVAKKYPVPVEVNIPKPYIVPIYKNVPVPIPHRVPKIINIIKEVPHYVKKPVPVYVDAHSSDYGGGSTFAGSGYINNDYGSNYHGGYASEEANSFAGPHGHSHHQNNLYNSMGMGYSNNVGNDYSHHHQTYNNPQENNKYNSPYFYNRQKIQYQNYLNKQKQKMYPADTYPRAHRLPNNVPATSNQDVSSNYYAVSQSSNVTNPNNNYAIQGNNPVYTGQVSPTSHQSQASAPNELYYQNANNINTNLGSISHTANAYNPHTATSNSASGYSQTDTSNSAAGYSQPVFNPSAYAEYTHSQQQYNQQFMYAQNNGSQQYAQPSYTESPTVQTTTMNPNMVSEASKDFPNYQQYPSNSFNSYGISQQSSNYNNIPQQEHYSNYNDAKSAYPHKSNFDFNNPFKQSDGFQPDTSTVSQWVNNIFQHAGLNSNKYMQPQQQNQLSSYLRQPSQNNPGLNKDTSHFNNPPSNNYNNFQTGYQSNFYTSNNQNQDNNYNTHDNYVPSGSSHSSNSYSNSYSPSSVNYQNGNNDNNAYKYNEKFDQSSSQNSYSSTSDIAAPGELTPSGQSSSYSSSTYGNNYAGNQVFPPQEPRKMSNSNIDITTTGNILNNDPINYPSSYSNFGGSQTYSPLEPQPDQTFNSGVRGTRNNVNGNHLSQSGSMSDYVSSPAYSPQENNQVGNIGITSQTNSNQQAQPDNLSNFVGSATSTSYNQPASSSYSQPASPSYSQPASSSYSQSASPSYNQPASPGYSQPASSSYTSTSYSNSNSYSMTPESTYQSPVYSSPDTQSYSNNASQNPTAFSSNNPIITRPDVTTSYSYSYTQQASDPAPAYSGSPYSNSFASDGQFKDIAQHNVNQFQPSNMQQSGLSSSYQKNHNPQIYSPTPSEPLQSYSPKLDEMDQHLQSSAASSIINVYTNSPNSKEAKKGQTFTFVDPASLESSQSSKYYLPPNPSSNTKGKYSNSDLQIIQGPSFNHDPNEPLQTSLDAYVPAQPVYYPQNNEQNTVYKEALTIADTVYKEAVSLDSSTKNKSR